MDTRRKGREAAIQLLYQRDIHGNTDDEKSIEIFWQIRAAGDAVKTFCNRMARGVMEHQQEIDALLQRFVENYEMHRVAMVDRNILRLAIYEMLYRPDIPPVVSINEAIELAKSLGSPESGRFVNGILDRIRGEVKRPLRTPQKTPRPSKIERT